MSIDVNVDVGLSVGLGVIGRAVMSIDKSGYGRERYRESGRERRPGLVMRVTVDLDVDVSLSVNMAVSLSVDVAVSLSVGREPECERRRQP
jgi:hypothetical protein